MPAQNNVVSLRSLYTGTVTWREYLHIDRLSTSNANTKANICLKHEDYIHSDYVSDVSNSTAAPSQQNTVVSYKNCQMHFTLHVILGFLACRNWLYWIFNAIQFTFIVLSNQLNKLIYIFFNYCVTARCDVAVTQISWFCSRQFYRRNKSFSRTISNTINSRLWTLSNPKNIAAKLPM